MNWRAVELHTHTSHSDGKMTVEELLQKAKENHLAIIALTDHNTNSGLLEAGSRVIPGIEWTTYYGHMTVLGASRYVDWRDMDPRNLDEKLWEIRRLGGLFCVAHPFRMGSPVCTGCHFECQIKDAGLINLWEAWSGENAAFKPDNAQSLRTWTRKLDGGARTAAVYGRDWHAPEAGGPVAVTYIGVDGELTVPKALDSLRHGRTAVTMGPAPVLTVKKAGRCYHPGDEVSVGPAVVQLRMMLEDRREIWQDYDLSIQQIRLLGPGGRLLAQEPYQPEGNSFLLYLENGYLRAEVWGEMQDKACLLAFTSAVFFRHATMITAHAGAEDTQPNSITSIRQAIETGCEAMEVDVRCHQETLVLSHNPVADNQKDVVTLEQCFSMLAAVTKMRINCDMKETGLVKAVVELARKWGLASRLIFTGSLDEKDMRAFPERPEAFWNIAIQREPAPFVSARKLSCEYVNLDKCHVTDELLIAARENGMKVSAWTADDEEEIKALLRMGVHNITTNYPILAMALREAMEREQNE